MRRALRPRRTKRCNAVPDRDFVAIGMRGTSRDHRIWRDDMNDRTATGDRTATLNFSDGSQSVSFPILSGTIGPDVIDIRTLYAKTGKFTYDPGYLSTASCNSTITYIDGDKGELLYRGY